MQQRRIGRVLGRSSVLALILYFVLTLSAGIFSGNACALLTAGIVFCIALPYTKWGLKILHREFGDSKGIAVDFHRRAIKSFNISSGRANVGHPGKAGNHFVGVQFRPRPSFVSVCCRFAATESGRQPDNIG